jgi:hypothetical protein
LLDLNYIFYSYKAINEINLKKHREWTKKLQGGDRRNMI